MSLRESVNNLVSQLYNRSRRQQFHEPWYRLTKRLFEDGRLSLSKWKAINFQISRMFSEQLDLVDRFLKYPRRSEVDDTAKLMNEIIEIENHVNELIIQLLMDSCRLHRKEVQELNKYCQDLSLLNGRCPPPCHLGSILKKCKFSK